ncbi:MAG TPA: glycosyl hydrolase [Miltoncostaeaceae bacterium]|nr:glycosyl hydrolase [Miltoncostaeaceae bacterium]
MPAGILTGAYIKGNQYDPTWSDAPWDARTINAFEANAGKACSVIHWGSSWGHQTGTQTNANQRPFYPGDSNIARNRGSYPMIDWSPSNYTKYPGTQTQPEYALSAIAGGSFDAYIDSWAGQVAAWGHPLFVRPMWEANGTWFPWCVGQNGNTAAHFVSAWQRIVSRARAVGANNITWHWCPNIIYSGQSATLAAIYPGDDYVDWVGCDGYNGNNAGYIGFHDLFKPTYDAIYALASPTKPFMLGEYGCAADRNKAFWFTEAFANVHLWFPRMRAMIYFNWSEASTWRIEDPEAARAAYAAGISPAHFQAATFAAAATSPIPAPA